MDSSKSRLNHDSREDKHIIDQMLIEIIFRIKAMLNYLVY
jgi:hypothetical protein